MGDAGYFNPEPEYGGRCYSLFVKTDEYYNFIKSDNPAITISGTGFSETTFVIKNGMFVEQNDTNEYESPTLIEINQPGNQDNDLKYFQFIFNKGVIGYIFRDFMAENLYLNGEKVFDNFDYSVGGWVGPESCWDAKLFYIWVDDNIRNYDGGIDVICIKKGAPIGGGMTIQEDVYFYGVRDFNDRDGAGNWKWTFSKEMPELSILRGGTTTISDGYVSATIIFDRVTNKNDLTLTPCYNDDI